jgi:hypothetical protein
MSNNLAEAFLNNELSEDTPIRLIGLYGKIGSGKDTVCKIIQTLSSDIFYDKVMIHLFPDNPKSLDNVLKLDWVKFMKWKEKSQPEDMYTEFESFEAQRFAGVLKRMVSTLTGASFNSLNDNEFKKTTDETFNLTFRELLQTVGESLRQDVDKDIWIKSLFRQFDKDSKWIIVDLRHPNEYNAVIEHGGAVVKIKGIEENDSDKVKNHISETGLDHLEDHEFDYVIENINREDKYQSLVTQVYEMLQEFKLIEL